MTKATGTAGRGKTTAASNPGTFASYQHAEPTIRLYWIGLLSMAQVLRSARPGQRVLVDEAVALNWVKFNVVMMRTDLELQGTPCIPMEEERIGRDQLIFSRSFAKPITTAAGIRQGHERVRAAGLGRGWPNMGCRRRS